MSSAFVRCLSCGLEVDSDSLRAKYGGACPHCLGAFALDGLLSSPGPTPVPSGGEFGKFILTDRLGKGGMGEVWKAFDKELKRWVALKFLRGESPQELARFQREARTAAALSHPGIAAIYEVGETNGRHYIAMQYVEGKTLQMHPRKDRKGLARLIRDAARALEHAHRHGVIHRDLKPENLIVEKSETETRVLILDFGLAKRIQGGESLSKSGTVAGTLAYMSPEQARGEKLDERSDVYSLGATLYEVLTGKPPFEGANAYEIMRRIEDQEPTTPRRLNQHIPHDLETITLKCLEKDKERRYGSAKDLADDLDRFLEGDAVMARRASTWYRVRMRLVKRKSVVLTATAASVVLSGFLGWWLFVASPSAEHDRRSAEALGLWAELLRSVGVGGDSDGIRMRAAKARSGFERMIELKGEASTHMMIGRCYALEGLLDESIKALERARSIDATHDDVRWQLAGALLAKYQASRGLPSSWFTGGTTGSPQIKFIVGSTQPETAEERKIRQLAESLLSPEPDAGSTSMLSRGLLALGSGAFGEAARYLESHWRAERWDLAALKLIAISQIYCGDFALAVSTLDQLIGRSRTWEHLSWRGTAKYALGHIDEALDDLDQSCTLNPGSSRSLTTRGFLKQLKGRLKEAIADFDAAIALNPHDHSSFNNRALAKLEIGDPTGAVEDCTHAIRLEPANAAAFTNRANAYNKLGRSDEAILDSNEAIRLAPKDHSPYLSRGCAYRRKGQLDLAIADATRALEKCPENGGAYLNRANALCERGSFAEAVTDFDHALRIDSTFADAYVGRAQANYSLRNYDHAIEDATKAIALNPLDAKAFNNRGIAHSMKGNLNEAISDLDEALRLEPKKYDSYYNRGLAKSLAGQHPDAVADFRMALELGPTGWSQRSNISYFLDESTALNCLAEAKRASDNKMLLRAIEDLERLVVAVPQSKSLRNMGGFLLEHSLARAYALLGDQDIALDWLEKAIRRGCTDPALLDKGGDLNVLRNHERYKALMAKLKGE